MYHGTRAQDAVVRSGNGRDSKIVQRAIGLLQVVLRAYSTLAAPDGHCTFEAFDFEEFERKSS